MTYLLVSFFISIYSSANEMPKEQLFVITQDLSTFKQDCLEGSDINKVESLTVWNKTSESLNKKTFEKVILERLGLKIDAKSEHKIIATLKSTVVKQGRIDQSTYDLQVELFARKQPRCKKNYTTVIEN